MLAKTICLTWLLLTTTTVFAQRNLLLNGDFEDINNCAEYHSECGVEAWFYMNAIKVQLSHANNNDPLLGNNTLTVYYNWSGTNSFYPVICTLLPCTLQKGKSYTFSGLFTAKFNSRLQLQPGVALGSHFFVPRRPFSQNIQPDSITDITKIEHADLYHFEYRFTATGSEQYLTFGTYIQVDEKNGLLFDKGQRETISLTMDHFELVADAPNEVCCHDYEANKQRVYAYDFRHKDMDYTLYGKGELPIPKIDTGTGNMTQTEVPITKPPPVIVTTDTILLGDVLFDFNQSRLKPTALEILQKIFDPQINPNKNASIDSIYVEGHTDAIGNEAQNLQLSRRRSLSVKDWLVQAAILPAAKISIHPFGKSRPISTNSTPQGRALNRRVALIIFRNTDVFPKNK